MSPELQAAVDAFHTTLAEVLSSVDAAGAAVSARFAGLNEALTAAAIARDEIQAMFDVLVADEVLEDAAHQEALDALSAQIAALEAGLDDTELVAAFNAASSSLSQVDDAVDALAV